MGIIRIIVRIPCIVVLTCSCALVIAASAVLQPISSRARLALRSGAYRLWARGFCALVGMRARVRGKPPHGAFILVANHLSYLDIILLASHLDAAFVAKSDLREWPLVGSIIAVGDTIFIDRGRKRDVLRVMNLISRALARDLGVVIFPEGTSGSGEAMLPFKPSLLEFAAQSGRTVHYATLAYHLENWHSSARDALCWWGDAPFLPHFFKMLAIPRFRADLVFGGEPVHADNRKVLAEKLRTAMARDFDRIKEDAVQP